LSIIVQGKIAMGTVYNNRFSKFSWKRKWGRIFAILCLLWKLQTDDE